MERKPLEVSPRARKVRRGGRPKRYSSPLDRKHLLPEKTLFPPDLCVPFHSGRYSEKFHPEP